jgi:hypothetical protein
MLRRRTFLAGVLAFLWIAIAAGARAQEIVDGLAARVESDVILLSEVRELGAYQQLFSGKREPDAQLLDRLIDQWIVRTEAEASRYPLPSSGDVNLELEKLKTGYPSSQLFEQRCKEAGLSEAALRRIVTEQLYLTGYLDSRFRPVVQIDAQTIDEFYEKTVVPLAKAKGETPPTLEGARETIRELLIQRGINEQSDRWLNERRSRLHIEKETA